MRRLTRSILILAALLSAVTVLAGCGGGGSSKKASSTGTTAAGAKATSAPSGGGGGDFCAKAASFQAKYTASFQKDLQAVATNRSDASARDKLKSDLQTARDGLKDAASSAPAQVKADVDTVFRVLDQYLSGLENANFDYAKLQQTNPNLVKALEDPNFTAATQRLTAYTTNVCHIAPPTTG